MAEINKHCNREQYLLKKKIDYHKTQFRLTRNMTHQNKIKILEGKLAATGYANGRPLKTSKQWKDGFKGQKYISRNIVKLLKTKGWSRSELAEKIGVTKQRIWQYEKQETYWREETIKKVAKALGVTPQKLKTK